MIQIAPAFAVDTDQRLMNLYDVIKCPTCEGQSIKDSNSESAELIRKNVDRLVREGASDEQIYSKIRTTYGEEAVTIPSNSIHNYLLWLFPMLIGGFFVYIFLRTVSSGS
jgi:cytochrome c-type biogenesis protein CcmH